MTAGVCHFRCEKGATFSRDIIWSTGTPPVPMNLTGYTIRGQVAKYTGDVTLVALTCAAVNAASGLFQISLTAAQTAALPSTGKTYSETSIYAYDLEMVGGAGVVTRLLNGEFQVSPEVVP